MEGSLKQSTQEVESRAGEFRGWRVRRRAQNGHWGQTHWRQAQRGCRRELRQHAASHVCVSVASPACLTLHLSPVAGVHGKLHPSRHHFTSHKCSGAHSVQQPPKVRVAVQACSLMVQQGMIRSKVVVLGEALLQWHT